MEKETNQTTMMHLFITCYADLYCMYDLVPLSVRSPEGTGFANYSTLVDATSVVLK